MSRKHRDRSWPPADAVAPLAAPVVDNHRPPAGARAAGRGPRVRGPAQRRRAGLPGRRRRGHRHHHLRVRGPDLGGRHRVGPRLPGVRVALALHPNEAVLHAGVREIGPDGLAPAARPHHGEPLDEVMARLEGLVRSNRDVVVAVGETGLDFFRTGERGADAQREAFRAHIALAKETGLPLQIHDRDAHEDCVRVLLADGAPERTVFHCFSGGAELARACAEHGWYASVAGPVTYPSNEALRAALALVPDELLLVETDAPYLPPGPWRGRPNASYLMGETVRFLAERRGLGEAEMCSVLSYSTRSVYGVPDGPDVIRM